jgi:L-lactate dehydrogenase (cytochrome)
VDPVVAARAAEIQDTERQRVAAAREALAPVEKILGIDEFEVRHDLRLC